MSKTWYGHHIETIKGEDYVLHKDYIEIQDKLYKCEKVLDKIKEYVENLLKEEFEITDPDNIYYGQKCRKPYFSDSELEKILELLEKIE